MNLHWPRFNPEFVVLFEQLHIQVNQILQRLFGFANARVTSCKKFIRHCTTGTFQVTQNSRNGQRDIQRSQDRHVARLWRNEAVQNFRDWLKALSVLIHGVGTLGVTDIVDSVPHRLNCLSCDLDGITQGQNPLGKSRSLFGHRGGCSALSFQFAFAGVLDLNNSKCADDRCDGANRLHPTSCITRFKPLAVSGARETSDQKKASRSSEEPKPPILSCDFYHGAIIA